MNAKIDDFEIPSHLLQMVTAQLAGSVHVTGEALSDKDRRIMWDGLSKFHEGQSVYLIAVSGRDEKVNGAEVVKKLETQDVDVGEGRKFTFHIFLERQ